MTNPPPPSPKPLTGLSAVKLALMAKQARAQVGAIARAEPIAIVGMGCRFPGGVDSPEAYWQLLHEGVDAVSVMPPERWKSWRGDELYDPDPAAAGKMAAREGGFVGDPSLFDAGFFGIQRREAEQMDPQHRVFLEVAIEALDRAGLTREQLAGSSTGVFVASYYNDYQQLLYGDPDSIDARSLTGTQHSVLANRLSYLLDLRGPSVSVDTACSSSLVAVHLACQSLRAGDSDVSVAAGVSLMLSPETMVVLSKVGFMSPSGRCRTLDASADGFIRGEGCGVVVLKRLSDAISDNDPILAVIRGSAVNQDGHSTVLTAPNGLAQQALVKAALANAQLKPERVGFVEMHGTATPLGDPIEVEALAATVGLRRNDGSRCYLGSAKANLGHLEAAAGVAGLIKATLVLQHGEIPRQPHFTTLNPHLSLNGTSLAVADRAIPWPAGGQTRIAGVSGFGVGGTNAHVLVEEAPTLPTPEATDANKDAQLLPLSAQTPDALRALAEKWSTFLPQSEESVARLVGTAGARRSHYDHRLAIVGRTREQLASQLAAFARGEDTSIAVGNRARGAAPKIAFVFSGQGAQWARMGRELVEHEPVFRDTLADVDRRFERLAGWSVAAAMADSAKTSGLQETMVAQPAIFAIQVALTALWESWGIRPEAVVGHSVGEIAAFYAAGVLSLDDALRIVWHRGRIMQRATGTGRMEQASISLSQAEALARDVGSALSIGAINGPNTVVLSGTGVALDRALTVLDSHHIAHRPLGVAYAFHSQAMAPFQAELTNALGTLETRPARCAVFSTVTGAAIEQTRIDGAYFGRNVRETVRFAPAVEQMLETGIDAFVEIAPHPVLGMSIAESAAARQQTVPVVASMRRERPERETMLQACATLYATGASPNWRIVTPLTTPPADLPSYPWQRERYWLRERPLLASIVESQAASNGMQSVERHGASDGMSALAGHWPSSELAWLGDHVIAGRTLMPAAAMAETLRRAIAADRQGDTALVDFIVHQPLALAGTGTNAGWRTVVSRNGAHPVAELHALSNGGQPGTLIASAHGGHAATAGDNGAERSFEISKDVSWRNDVADLYAANDRLGIRFGPAFRTIARWRAEKGIAEGWLQLDEQVDVGDGLHPTLIDGALQLIVIAARSTTSDSLPDAVFLPLGIDSFVVHRAPGAKVRAVVHVASARADAASLTAAVRLFDESGALVASLDGVRIARASASALSGLADDNRSMYEVRWSASRDKAAAHSAKIDARGAWLVFANEDSTGQALVETLSDAGGRCMLVMPGDKTAPVDESRRTIARGDVQGIAACVADQTWRGGDDLRGVVHAWSLGVESNDGNAPDVLTGEDWVTVGSALAVVQSLGRSNDQAPVWLVTRGAQPATAMVTHARQAGLWGFASGVAVEQPDLRCHVVDLDPFARAHDVGALIRELVGKHDGDLRVALRGNDRLAPELVRYGSADSSVPKHGRVESASSGTLDGVSWRAASVRAPKRDEVRVRVAAAGINFRDVLIALGMYPDAAAVMGAECAGVVEEVGDAVSGVRVNDVVFGFAPGGLATDVTIPARYVTCIPDGLSVEQAAALPAAFLTAMYALRRVAHIEAGKRVLIHAGAGGVGMAAIQIAQQAGAEVFATVGSPAKRALLKRLGVQHVFDSRSTAFAEKVLEATDGTGVDIVLNSLAEEFIAAGVSTLARGGWFVELGKRGIWSNEQMRAARPDAQYRAFDLGEELAADSTLAPSMLAELCAGLKDRTLRPLPVRAFEFAHAGDALRFMAQARHTGKLVLRSRTPGLPESRQPIVRGDATYWITGGTGAIGVRTARWLAERGARDIVLTSRGPALPESQSIIDDCVAAGARIHVRFADAGDESAMRAIRDEINATLPPLRGVVHAAGSLDDGVLAQQTWERFRGVLHGKAHGARVLDALTRESQLDFFVLYSSAAQLLGPLGQGAYPAANAELDALAWERRGAGLPALSVGWGQWAGAGMAARTVTNGSDNWSERGLTWLEVPEAFACLERLLRDGATYAAVMPIDWARFLSKLPTGLDRDFYRGVAPSEAPTARASSGNGKTAPSRTASSAVVDGWRTAPAGDRRRLMVAYLADRARHVLGIDESVVLDPATPLKDAGLDSLMAVELRNLLTRSLGRSLAATLLFDYPSLDELVEHLTGVLGFVDKAPPPPPPVEALVLPVDDLGVRQIAEMSDAEAEALLLAELDRRS